MNPRTKKMHDFYVNKVPGEKVIPPERPTAVKFDPTGTYFYVVDFGELVTDTGVFFPSALTGGLWRICRV